MEPPSTISLVMIQGPRSGETLEFPPGSTIRIGRILRGNSVAIKDSGISTKHLSIESDSVSGKWILRDLDSSNGTFLNGTKIPPFDAFTLSNDDIVKFGEWTSVSIRLGRNEESQLRRNPRRKATESQGGRGKVLEEVENDVGLESGRCNRPRRGKGLKCEVADPESLDVGSEVGDVIDSEFKPAAKIRTRGTQTVKNDADSVIGDGEEVKVGIKKTRGRPRGRKNLHNELSNCGKIDVLECTEKIELGENVLVDDREGEKNVNIGKTGKGSSPRETCDQDGGEVKAGAKKTRGGTRGRKNLQNEPSDCSRVIDLQCTEEVEPRENVLVHDGEGEKNVNVGKVGSGSSPKETCEQDGGEVKAGAKKTRGGTRGRKDLRNEPPDGSKVSDLQCTEKVEPGENVLYDGEGEKNVNVGKTGCGSSPKEICDQDGIENVSIVRYSCEKVADGRAAHNEDFPCKAEKVPDLKKMTLGEWFDYLETHLPKQIIDATEEIISGMRIKSAQVTEYITQRKEGEMQSRLVEGTNL